LPPPPKKKKEIHILLFKAKACERSEKRNERAENQVSARKQSGERTFQKRLERQRSVERGLEATEQEWSEERAKSAAQSPLTPIISLI